MYKIVADSSCDLRNIEIVPLTIYNDAVSYLDNESLNITQMLNFLSTYKGKTMTACPGGSAWMNAFEGSEEVYVVTLTGALSGTFNSAETARLMYQEDHPEVKIKVFDSLSTGPEMCLIIEKIQELKEKGLSFDEVCTQVEAYQKHTHLFFILQSLHNLAENGRVSKVIASAIGVLGIRIIAKASEEGTIEPIAKSRNDSHSLKSLLKHVKEAGFHGGKVRICHVENEELANRFRNNLLAEYPHADIRVYPARGLVSYYAERGGILVGCETT